MRCAYTLIEILVIMAIVAILAMIIITNVQHRGEQQDIPTVSGPQH